MIAKIIIRKNCTNFEDIGTYYIQTNDKSFLDEIDKYICPFRIIDFIDKQLEANTIQRIDKTASIDLEKDLSLEYERHLQENKLSILTVNDYISNTPHLDKYGN